MKSTAWISTVNIEIFDSDDFESDIPVSLYEDCAMSIPSVVRQVLVKTHDVNSRGWACGFIPFIVCVSGTERTDSQIIIKILHAARDDINIKDTEKSPTPMQYTALRNNPLCAKILLKCRTNVHITDINGATALHGAIYHGHLKSQKFIKCGKEYLTPLIRYIHG